MNTFLISRGNILSQNNIIVSLSNLIPNIPLLILGLCGSTMQKMQFGWFIFNFICVCYGTDLLGYILRWWQAMICFPLRHQYSHFILSWNWKDSFVCSQTLQEVINIQPNLTKSSGSCDTSSALLTLTTDAEKTNLTFVFALVTSLLSPLTCVNSLFSLLCFSKQPLDGANGKLVFSSEHYIQ